MPRETLYGKTEPRVFTPPLRELTPETSAGYAVIEFAEGVLGIELYPWQKWLLIHALELLPDGLFRFRTIVLLVGRQNGKSTLGQVIALWFLYVRQVRLVLGTAQSLDIAGDLWSETVDIARDVPDLDAEIVSVTRQITRETLELTGRRRYKVAAASRKGGRGKTGDLVLLDELREHQNWYSWSAITKSTMARAQALVWCMSNAGDETSVVLTHLRKQAHRLIGDPDGVCAEGTLEPLVPESGERVDEELAELLEEQASTLGLFEWSSAPERDRWDRAGWAEANPSLGYGELTERNIASACATDPEAEFMTEVLCRWVGTLTTSPFAAGAWDAGTTTEQPPPGTEELTLGIDMDAARTKTQVVAAYRYPDGRVQASLEASRPGSEWVCAWLAERASEDRPLTVALQGRGAPVSSLVDEIAALENVTVMTWGGVDLGNATARVYDMVNAAIMDEHERGEVLWHMPAPALDVAASLAVPKVLTDGGKVWDRNRSPGDISPLVALTAALWALHKAEVDRQVSAYDDGAELMVL